MRILLLLLAVGMAAPSRAADVSTYTFNSGMNCQGVWRLPDTGQSTSYTDTFGEDHDYQPAAVQMSYTVLNPVGISSVTVDNVTGLMWITNPQTDAGIGGTYTWEGALGACTGKSYAGYTDWRLPNVRELSSVINYGVAAAPRIDTTAFPGTASASYWTSTTYLPADVNAWEGDFTNAEVSYIPKIGTARIRCVRNASLTAHSFAGCAFPDTNQSLSFTSTSGEDHDYASSISTMSFTVYNPVGVSSVTVDNRTGLMWITNPRTDAGFDPGPSTWAVAISSFETLSYAGYTDWRLPNLKELLSIVDYDASSPPIDARAFPNAAAGRHWTSTTDPTATTAAFFVGFTGGVGISTAKTTAYNVRCVRGGP